MFAHRSVSEHSMNIETQIAKLGSGPLTEVGLREHVWPLFSRAMAGDKARNEIYLANHSLGRPLDQMALDVNEGIEAWYSQMDGAWGQDAWLGEMNSYRSQVARLIGINDPTAVVPKTSAGQGLRAVLNALPQDGKSRPVRVLATCGEFDSIDIILKTYAKKGRAEMEWIPMQADASNSQNILSTIKQGLDLVVISMVVFATGEVISCLDEIIRKSHAAGALVLLDAYHSAGIIPVNMTRLDADFMIGGCYKYTRGGPGACWLAINPKHLGSELRTLDTGWFAKKDPFGYERLDEPILSESGDAWLESTAPVLTYYQARSGLALTLAIGVERLREYNLIQQKLLRKAFAKNGVEFVDPQNPEERGAFTLVPSRDSLRLVSALKRAGINTDSRGGFVRFGPDILNSAVELVEAARITGETIRSDETRKADGMQMPPSLLGGSLPQL